jgi:hypothetical protein
MPDTTKSLWIAVSPERRLCGIATLMHEQLRIRLIVLPKLWRTAGTPTVAVCRWNAENPALSIIAYEGDTLELQMIGEDQLVRQRHLILVEFLQRTLHHQASVGQAPARLVELGHRRRHEGLPLREPPTDGDVVHALIHLLRLSEWVGQPFDLFGAGNSLGAACRDPLLRPLLHAQFLSRVESNLRNVRRGYVEVTSSSTVIRGKPHVPSLVRALHGASRLVDCTHDDFNYSTALQRVIATALDEIIRHGDGADSPLRHLASRTVVASMRVRRRLATVDAMDPGIALRIASRMRLARHELPWNRALHLARPILARRGLAEGIHGEDGETTPILDHCEPIPASQFLRIAIDSARAWEALLERAAIRLGRASRKRQLPSPWEGVGDSLLPDILVERQDGQCTLIDAKYKDSEEGGVDTKDLMQMYAYSHLKDWGQRSPLLVLARARRTLAPFAESRHARRQAYRMPNGDATLVVAELAWPNRSQLGRQEQYMQQLVNELEITLRSHPL